MKGYVTACGYMGYVENEYILFASEDDYFEYVDFVKFLINVQCLYRGCVYVI